LMVEYRDFRFIVPFIVQFGLYISPVGFLSSIVSDRYGDSCRLVYSLNPIVGVIDGFRWSILGGQHTLFWPGLIASVIGVAVLFLSGLWYFRKMERTFADVI
jgi:lipopolysaccharide transport system permease protein